MSHLFRWYCRLVRLFLFLGTNWLLLLFRSLIGFDLGVALDRLRRSRVVGGLSGCSLARRLCFVS